MSTPLEQAKTSWIDSITVDSDDETAIVVFNVPAGPGGETSSYEEELPLDGKGPAYLEEAARNFSQALVKAVRERIVAKGDVERCVTCTSSCCHTAFDRVHVTQEDVQRLGPQLVARGVDLFPHSESWNGYAGLLKRKKWHGDGEDEDETACIFLDPTSRVCTIYSVRPGTCSNYTAYDCDEHELASEKLVKLRRKAFAGA